MVLANLTKLVRKSSRAVGPVVCRQVRLLWCVESDMTIPTGRQVLQLYRDLLRYGRQLQFTDKDYFARRIRKEFKQAKNIDNAEDIKFYYQRGLALLKNKRVV